MACQARALTDTLNPQTWATEALHSRDPSTCHFPPRGAERCHRPKPALPFLDQTLLPRTLGRPVAVALQDLPGPLPQGHPPKDRWQWSRRGPAGGRGLRLGTARDGAGQRERGGVGWGFPLRVPGGPGRQAWAVGLGSKEFLLLSFPLCSTEDATEMHDPGNLPKVHGQLVAELGRRLLAFPAATPQNLRGPQVPGALTDTGGPVFGPAALPLQLHDWVPAGKVADNTGSKASARKTYHGKSIQQKNM